MSTITLREPATSSTALGVADDDLYEIIDGQRVGQPPRGIYSVLLASQLIRYLGNYADTMKSGRAVSEGLFHMPAPINRDRRPDVAYVSYQRWPKSRSVPRTDNAWDVVPNLNVEVVSPNDKADEVQEKVDEYFRAGVELVWVVYPPQSQIYVYQSPTQIRVLTVADELDGGNVLPGFRLRLAELFSEPTDVPINTNGSEAAN